jgi:site-specific DNA recombinase
LAFSKAMICASVRMDGWKAHKKELETFLTNAEEPLPLLHPEMANFYRLQAAELYDALQEEVVAKRLKAGEVLRLLAKEIILTPGNGELQIEATFQESLRFRLKAKHRPQGPGHHKLRWLPGRALIRNCAFPNLKAVRECATI